MGTVIRSGSFLHNAGVYSTHFGTSSTSQEPLAILQPSSRRSTSISPVPPSSDEVESADLGAAIIVAVSPWTERAEGLVH